MIYGTYGKSKAHSWPYRVDIGTGDKSDFITVGKIDNSIEGKYANKKKLSYKDIVLSFHYLSESKKLKILNEQFEKEKKYIKEYVENWRLNHNTEPIFEIANEPNLFPYLSPETYAIYYKLWHDEIKKVEPNAKIMIGGLWIYEGLPKMITNALSFLNIKGTDTVKYLKDFLYLLELKYHPDILNLHFYPYVDKYKTLDIDGHFKNLEKIMNISKFKEVWITEFGNINTFNLTETSFFIEKLLERINKLKIDRIYFFKTTLSYSHWGIFYMLNEYYNKHRIWFKLIYFKISLLFFWSKRKLLKLLKNYIKNPPIQHLESDGNLNSVGEVYKHYSEKLR